MTAHLRTVVLFIFLMTGMHLGCGGGSDVGNPYNPVVGTVSSRFSDGPKAAGARVVLSKRGADPGFGPQAQCSVNGEIGICSDPIFFDTTYTDEYGRFRFETVLPGSYVLVAFHNELLALEYIEQRAYQDGEAALVVSEPATVYLKNYASIDTSQPYFRAARIAGTGFIDSINESGEIVLRNVPAAKLDLILYSSDFSIRLFPALQTDPGCRAELYTAPELSVSYWTPHPCGPRDPLGRPYILESLARTPGSTDAGFTRDGRLFDIRINFSHAMDALSTGGAIQGYSDDNSASVGSLWWEGGNIVYISLCVADSAGVCRGADERFSQGVTYGVTIDTTAQTALGVHFAHDAYIRFIPVP